MHYNEHIFLRIWKQKHEYYIIYLNMWCVLLLKCFNMPRIQCWRIWPSNVSGFRVCIYLNQIKVTKYIVLGWELVIFLHMQSKSLPHISIRFIWQYWCRFQLGFLPKIIASGIKINKIYKCDPGPQTPS